MSGGYLIIGVPALVTSVILMFAWNHPSENTRWGVRSGAVLSGVTGLVFSAAAFESSIAITIGLTLVVLFVLYLFFLFVTGA